MTFVRSEEVEDDWGRGFAAAKDADRALLDGAARRLGEMEAEIERLRASLADRDTLIWLLAKSAGGEMRAHRSEIVKFRGAGGIIKSTDPKTGDIVVRADEQEAQEAKP